MPNMISECPRCLYNKPFDTECPKCRWPMMSLNAVEDDTFDVLKAMNVLEQSDTVMVEPSIVLINGIEVEYKIGSHIVNGKFQSDKYPTTPPDLVPLKVTDPTAQDLLWEYANRRRSVDKGFADDLQARLVSVGYKKD